MSNCKKCNEYLDGEDDIILETINCIFHLCVDCSVDIEGIIEDSLNAEETS